MKTIIRHGRIIDPANSRDEVADLMIVDGVIAAAIDEREAEIIDASGLIVAPGLIDIHVHLREPGLRLEGNDRIRCARRGSGRLHHRRLHAEYFAGRG